MNQMKIWRGSLELLRIWLPNYGDPVNVVAFFHKNWRIWKIRSISMR